jgi:non-reducing end alpha-L-arabinofuranosidase
MRSRLLRLAGATVLALMAADGCGTSSGGGSGGSSGGSVGTGGSGAGGVHGSGGGGGSAGGACPNVTPCGGDLVGTWTVSSSCLNVTGQLDLTLVGAGCASAPVTGSLEVSGTWTANSDGTYTDGTLTTGSEQFTLAPDCLVISSAPVTCAGVGSILASLGYDTVTCTDATGGGCACSATVHQTGTLGWVSPAASTSGNYTTATNVVTISGDAGDATYPYCASANTLTLTPQSTSPTTTGTIVLHKGGSTGTGGATGNGGTGSGGSHGSGGVTGSGGATGSGGQAGTGTGGKAGTGGVTGTGGTTGTGGQAGAGGKLGTGGAAGSAGKGGATGTGGSGSTTGPCDIYKSGGTPCVAAHSTVRALFGAYSGKLYQIRNAAGTTKDINAVAAGGVADGSAQDTFCSGTTCVITIVYDQTGDGHDLQYQGSGSTVGGQDKPASATGESIKLAGNKVYSLYIAPGNSYWTPASIAGIPTGSAPEGMYMVTGGKHYNSGCCFDYGNSESDRKADGAGAMDAINFSNITAWGTGAGSGPWVMADLEYGIFAQNNTNKNQNDPSQTATFITAVLKNNGTTEFALKGADATTGDLTTYYKGGLPAGWSPMKKQGAMVLGSGGDCCATNTNLSDGTFYEGCLVSGYPSDATESAVQANIVAARYGN